jgi:hypothetical protein
MVFQHDDLVSIITVLPIICLHLDIIISWRSVLDTTLCDKVRQLLATGRWFSPGIPVSSTNKIDRHDITEILLKVALNTLNLTKPNQPSNLVCTTRF